MKNQPIQSKLHKQISKTFELINPHLYSVEERIKAQAREFDPAVEGYIAYACESKGKRIRPALALLSGAATSQVNNGHLDLAVIVELIHLATLVHDDIIDGAEIRRNQPTTNAKWGNSLSVLLGDALFAHALKLSTNFQISDISRKIAHAASEVCSGEIMQTQRRFDLKLSIPDYFRIIEMKTASLFSVAAELGAFISEASPEVISAMKSYGTKLGVAYQIYDDVLDLAGKESEAGKSLGTDLRKGKLTLPVLLALKEASSQQHEQLRQWILGATDSDAKNIVQFVQEQGHLKESIRITINLIHEAQASLQILPPSKYAIALHDIGSFLEQLITPYK